MATEAPGAAAHHDELGVVQFARLDDGEYQFAHDLTGRVEHAPRHLVAGQSQQSAGGVERDAGRSGVGVAVVIGPWKAEHVGGTRQCDRRQPAVGETQRDVFVRIAGARSDDLGHRAGEAIG